MTDVTTKGGILGNCNETVVRFERRQQQEQHWQRTEANLVTRGH